MISHNWSPMKRLIWLRGSGITGGSGTWDTISGNPVSFTAKAAPLRQLEVAFSPVQSGSGDPSPDNVRPISGWSSLTVEQRGKNLFDPSKVETGKWLNLTTGEIENAAGYAVSDYIFVKAGQAYTITQPNSIRRWFYDLSKNPLSLMENVTTFTPTQDCYIRITLGTNLTPVDTYMVVMGNTLPSEFAPYNPSSRSISISLGQTVYSGTLDVVNGKMTVDRAMVARTWGDFSYKSTLGSYVRGSYDLPNRAVYPATAKTPQISNVAPHWANFASDTLHFYCNGLQAIFFLPVGTPDSTAIQISYELATPFELTLTPEQISTLQGTNNMWSDAGDVTVEYRKN